MKTTISIKDILHTLALLVLGGAGIVGIYTIIWLVAYPSIGARCTEYNTAKTVEIEKAATAWNGAQYKVTFDDGSQMLTGEYNKPGSQVCIHTKAVWPW